MRIGFVKASVRRNLALVSALAGFIAACSGAPSSSSSIAKASGPQDPLAGVTEDAMTALGTAPTFASGVLTVTVAKSEMALLSLRPADSAILVNGSTTLDSKGAVVTSTSCKQISVVEDAGAGKQGAKEVVIDYTNGLFATGTTSAASSSIVLALGTTGTNTLGIKGQAVADKIVAGANGFNMNGDKYPDVVWASGTTTGGAGAFIVSMGAGDDTWSAGGDTATGGVFANGTAGVTVYGGVGNDTFLEGTAQTTYEKIYGGGQAKDTVDYSARSAAVTVTMGAGTHDDGESGENDDIQSDVLVVNGGSGNDSMTALPSAGGVDYPVTFNGNAGNDTLTPYGGAYVMNGGDGNDTFAMGDDTKTHGPGHVNGGNGVDLVDFSGRLTNAITVVMDGKTAGGAATELMFVGADVENINGSKLGDTITGNALDNVINGEQGNDTLNGGAGDDRFDESINVVQTAAATDSGSDTISGGAGTDTVDYSSRTAAVFVGLDGVNHSGAGTLTQTFGASTDTPAYSTEACTVVSAESDTVNMDVENATGGAGADCLLGQPANTALGTTGGITVTSLANTLVGGAGNDILMGFDDDDVLEGGAAGNTEKNALDCGAGQGNIGYNSGSDPASYKLTCQF